jgi:enolase-phosphatase E1
VAIINNITWQMKQDRKIAALKSFQGYMWKNGFETGEIKGMYVMICRVCINYLTLNLYLHHYHVCSVYDDVVEALHKWKAMGHKVYIYSSGSVQAQKLLFKYSNKGDLLEVS